MGDLWTHDALDCLMVDLLCAHSLSLLFLSTLVPPFILPSVSVRTYCPHGCKSLGYSMAIQYTNLVVLAGYSFYNNDSDSCTNSASLTYSYAASDSNTVSLTNAITYPFS